MATLAVAMLSVATARVVATLAVAATPKNANNKNAFEQKKILRTVTVIIHNFVLTLNNK